GRLIGRAEMLSQSKGISSSYSCPGGNCPMMFSYAFIDPSDVYLTPGDGVVIHVLEVDCDAYGCVGPFSPYVTGWDVNNPDFAILFYGNGSEADILGLFGGSASFQANIGYEQYAWDGLECLDGGFNIADTGGDAHVLHINSISPDRSLVGATVAVTIFGGCFDPTSTPTINF